jgi:hypothetical protein
MSLIVLNKDQERKIQTDSIFICIKNHSVNYYKENEMTDLDNTQIITDDESLLQNSSTIDTVREILFRKLS